MKKVIRRLNRDSLEKDFYYDRPKESDLRGEAPVVVPNLNLSSTRTPEIKTPPLPLQPQPVVQQTSVSPVLNTGLTATETALLSPDEQAIRLKQKGIA